MEKRSKRIRLDEFRSQGLPAGLTKTKKIIRCERDKEIQFIKFCKQIKLEEFRDKRAENQREERRMKRR